MAKPEVYHPTGHGILKRKPVPDDAKSSKPANSKKSDELSSIHGPSSSVLVHKPTGYENRLQDGIDLDQIRMSAAESCMYSKHKTSAKSGCESVLTLSR